MSWETAEKASLVASAGLALGCATIGFKWVASPYLKGYASAGVACYVFSRLAARAR